MSASRLLALAGVAALLVGAPAPAQPVQNESYAAPAYAPPPPPPPPYDSGAPSYQPVDPGYLPPAEGAPAAQPIPPAAYPEPAYPAPPPPPAYSDPAYPVPPPPPPAYPAPSAPAQPAPAQSTAAQPAATPCSARPASGQASPQQGIPQNDVVSAAEGVFGKGAAGLGGLIEKIFKERGAPNAYIAGREAGGAFLVGVRYGSGTMCHNVEGDRKVYWTGPSIGFDWGADANKVFVLVYNLHDSQELFRRFPNAEGHAYLVGGFSASVLKRGDVVLVPVRLGVGVRLGVNAGYMAFSEKSRWLPF